MDGRVRGYFDPANGSIIRQALDLIDHYPMEFDERKNISDYARLIREHYGFYLEFRRRLSCHLIEKINLRIVDFAKEEEFALKERIQTSSEALWAFFDAALDDYRRELTGTAAQEGSGARRPGYCGRSVCGPETTR